VPKKGSFSTAEIEKELYCPDSELLLEAYRTLRTQGGVSDEIQLARKVFRIRGKTPPFAAQLANSLLEGTSPFVREGTGNWALNGGYPGKIKIEDCAFAVIDLETTGGRPPAHKITEIGGVRIERGKIVESYHTLVNPEREIPPFITRFTGINQQMVAEAPVIADVLPRLREFMRGAVFVGHNANFDLQFIDHEIQEVTGGILRNPILDTIKLAKALELDTPKFGLDSLVEYFNIRCDKRHRALPDAEMTGKVLLKLLAIARKNGIRTLRQLIRLQTQPD
jgi:DNA polymerase III epsilon subunit family exonuclease